MPAICQEPPIDVNRSMSLPITMTTASTYRPSAVNSKTRNSPQISLWRTESGTGKNLLVTSENSLISLLSENTADRTGDKESEKLWSDISRQQILKVVTEWFELWQPWQQKVLLSGITDRCSTNQLETLATSLEPIFHRDFVTHLRKKYPTSPLRLSTTRRRSSVRSISSKRMSLAGPGVKSTTTSRRQSKKDTEKASINQSLFSIKEGNDDHAESAKCISDGFLKSLDDFSEKISKSVLSEAMGELCKPQTVECVAQILTKNTIRDAINIVKEDAGNLVAVPEVSDQQKDITEVVKRDPRRKNSILNPTLSKRRSSKRSDSLTTKATTGPGEVGDPDQQASLKDVIENELKKSKLLSSRQNVDGLDLHLADRSFERRAAAEHHNSLLNHDRVSQSYSISARTPSPSAAVNNQRLSQGSISFGLTSIDFFDRKTNEHLGHMKREMRTGRVHKPAYLRELTLASQRRLPPRIERAATNLQTRTPTGSDRFQLQMDKIWQWLSAWQGHEKLSLLSEIIKQCSGDLIKYLTQCLSDRLKERLNISWLPDRLVLLIFSYLDSDDIETCSKVCRRWRHTAAMDELWMIKCLEYGQYEGIPDIIRRVTDANREDHSIDWKTAYFELQRITRDAKSALAKPNPIDRVREPSIIPVEDDVVSADTAKESIEDLASVTTEATEVPLKRGTAAQLARESRRLKQGHMTSEDEDDWWNQREVRSEGAYPQGRSVTLSPQSTVLSLPKIGEKSKKLGRLSRSLDIVSAHGSPSLSKNSSRHTSHQGAPEPLFPALQTQTQPSLLNTKSEDNIALVSSQAKKAGGEKAETKALLQWIRGKKKLDDGEGEVALDVRPNLVQATDILGKSRSKHILRWKDNLKINRKYAGQVPGVRRVRKFHGHMDAVLCVEFGARRLISGSTDQSVRVWDIRSGRSIHKMYGHKGAITCLKFDQNVLYSGSWDTLVMVWDLVTFERVHVLPGHRGTVSCLAINQEYLVSGSHDSTVRVYRRRILQCERTLCIHESHVVGLELDRNNVISASSDRTIRLTNIDTGISRKLVLNHPEPIHKMLLEGSLLITATQTGRVYFWNYVTGESEAGIQAHDAKHPINALAFHGGRFFTASGDQTVKEWDLLTMTCVRSLQGHKAAIRDFKVSDKRMVSCSTDGQIRIWDFDVPEEKLAQVTESDDTIPYEVVNQQMVA